MRDHRLEVLVESLAARLRDEPLGDPMVLEPVAVPSRGSERWLSQRLAERGGRAGLHDGIADGICAGLEFPFPGGLVEHVVEATIGTGAAHSAWRPQRLTWPVLEVLDDLAADRGPSRDSRLAPLGEHLTDGGEPALARRLPLARRIADTFDRYALLRPRMVAAWEAGHDVGPGADLGHAWAGGSPAPRERLDPRWAWQPWLWRHLCERLGTASAASRLEHAITALRAGEVDPAGLPPRVSVFGVTALPPAHLRLLSALGEVVDTTVYLLVASPALWPAAPPTNIDDAMPGELAVAEPDHPLLSSLGGVGLGMGWACASIPSEVRDATRAAGDVDDRGTLLERVQRDLAADRRPDETPSCARDTTVQIHGCYGPARQVEVLREVLTGLLADHPGGENVRALEPRDVLVMTPDLDTYAPLIAAVFDDTSDDTVAGAPPLPARIADRRLDAANEVAVVLLGLLDLPDARVSASAVLDLLAAAAIRRRFDLEDRDLDALDAWVRATGIRWGIDAEYRASHGWVQDAAHTWEAGLDRLRLGVAMPDVADRVVGEAVPYDDLEGDDVERFGRVSRALQTVFAHTRGLREPRSVAQWRDALLDALDAVASVGRDDAWQREQVREVLEGLVDDSRPDPTRRDGSGAEPPPSPVLLTLTEIRGELAARLGRHPAAAAYATGAITVCEPAPLRAVPHRVVCLLGVDDEVFPRASSPLGFDLVASAPQPADRDARREDRQLLLDAIMAAREHLVVTYTSHDPRTNEPSPPCAPVAELLETVACTTGLPARDAGQLVVHHPLHPFDPAYFREGPDDEAGAVPGLRSFDPQRLAAARAYTEGRRPAGAFLSGGLAGDEPGDEPVTVDLVVLDRFLRNPLRQVLRDRLGLAIALREGVMDDRDPFELAGLERWSALEEQLERWRGGADLERWREAALRRGAVPAGTPGGYVLDDVGGDLRALLRGLSAEDVTDPADWAAEPVEVDLALDVDGVAHRLVGTIDERVGERLVTVQASRLDARASLRAWPRLLAAGVTAGVCEAVVVGRSSQGRGQASSVRLTLPDEAPASYARDRLVELLRLLRRGQGEPLPVMPKTGAAYVDRLGREGEAAALKAARTAWDGSRDDGERTDDAVALALGDDVPLDALIDQAWITAARTIWDPLLDRGGKP
ncbi:exodeoxyribonuclease V subunit gamma [Egibacter rhizosphaerae]|uniref:exodeoxyribonuclease V subunit gamma n=1 Tax=Egibacter rhizosphaerae TaxID=1670831 RepID=UPI0013F16015|nr:exodeoxyribonuclease V subunit gamma [Egibacter rhizosphaerae]